MRVKWNEHPHSFEVGNRLRVPLCLTRNGWHKHYLSVNVFSIPTKSRNNPENSRFSFRFNSDRCSRRNKTKNYVLSPQIDAFWNKPVFYSCVCRDKFPSDSFYLAIIYKKNCMRLFQMCSQVVMDGWRTQCRQSPENEEFLEQ
jgi:hypothetical protein